MCDQGYRLWFQLHKFGFTCHNCEYATPDLVEQAEAALKHAFDVHLNHPTLEMQRYGEDVMD